MLCVYWFRRVYVVYAISILAIELWSSSPIYGAKFADD